MATDGLIARCQQCGGNVELRIAGPPITCGFCAAAGPLDERTTSRLEQLRTDLVRHGGSAQQLAGKQRLLARRRGSTALVVMLALWAIVGAALWFTPAPLPDGVGVGAALFHGVRRQPDTIGNPIIMRWWFVFACACGFSVNLLLWSLYRRRIAQVASTVLPLPPAGDGRAPRCRCCGADLAAEGSVRRCEYCEADHIVMGQRYQQHQASLDRALEQLRRQVSASLQQRASGLERFGALSTFLPLSLVLLMPAAVFAPGTYPVLWAFPGLALIASLVIIGVAAGSAVPAPRTLSDVRAGDAMIVSGTRYEVQATFRVAGQGELSLLRSADGALLGVCVELDADDTFQARTFAVSAGGDPYTAALGSVERLPLDAAPSGLFAGRDQIAALATMGAGGQVLMSICLWAAQPAAGQPPELTLEPASRVDESGLVLIARERA
ncbi:MAG: hypothetical protein KC503_24025 [Myxococcales bacterium]|nr:hypothetical protein [Myxococcales bacterium]